MGWQPPGPSAGVRAHRPAPGAGTGRATPFTFGADGPVGAIVEARAVARGKDVHAMGGAHVAQQYLRSGLLDEMVIHLVPLLLGDDIRLFDNLGPNQIRLVQTQVTTTPEVVHLRYRFMR
jgi:dihydrofolate reductase